jgi:23S rRNA (cytosine1962-C5)-methyltransferase
MSSITLKPDREKSLLRKHPWIFSNAIGRVDGSPMPGETVEIQNDRGEWLARGAWSPQSQISIRVWTFDQSETIDEAFFNRRLSLAIERRKSLGFLGPDGACRLVNAESDGLPGLVVDRYADFSVCQFLSTGAEYWKKTIADLLLNARPSSGVYERSDVEVRYKEGLEKVTGPLRGSEPPNLVEIVENGLRFGVDVKNGHKTGFYLDQRDNRAAVAGLARDAEVLNCFAYTGGFGIAALRGGAARITQIDTSGPSLELARQNAERNGLDPEKIENVEGDVFELLRKYRDSRRSFDLIVLDPPKFAESRSQIDRAARGYKDINLLAFKLLRPGGILATFSCSGLVTPDLFEKIVAGAALDSGRDAQIVRHLTQSADHPVSLAFPEGFYLKGLICRV